MTYERAIEILNPEHREHYESIEPVNEACRMGIQALEKQIPKNPIADRYPWCICPVCGGSIYVEKVQEHIQENETTYCEHCGQALDWSDTE
jgi:hypothetical protein